MRLRLAPSQLLCPAPRPEQGGKRCRWARPSLACLALACVLLACTRTRRDPNPDPVLSKPVPVAAPPIDFDQPGALPPALAERPTWQLAATLDPMDLSRLAGELGAARLALTISEGGRAGSIALWAFEHAPDAHAERAELCALLPRLRPPQRRVGLAVVERVLQGPRFGEVIHPAADTRCETALAQLEQEELSAQERDLLATSRLHIARSLDVDYARSE